MLPVLEHENKRVGYVPTARRNEDLTYQDPVPVVFEGPDLFAIAILMLSDNSSSVIASRSTLVIHYRKTPVC